MGDWKYVNGGWEYDPGAPAPDPTVTSMLPVYAAREDASTGPFPAAEQPSRTAGEQDHTDPWVYAGPVADAPVNC